jgi:hypothetical protein
VVSAARAFGFNANILSPIVYAVKRNTTCNSILVRIVLADMARIKKTVWLWKCERCGYEWLPRDPEATDEPKRCPGPNCKSPYWNKPRQSKPRKAPKTGA